MLNIIRASKSFALTGMGKTMTNDHIKDGLFVPFFSVGGRAVGCFESEINAINAAKAAGKSNDEIRELVKKLIAKRSEIVADYLSA